MGQAGVEAWEAEHEDEPDQPSFSTSPPNNTTTIFKFAGASDLLISGGVNNAQQLAGAPGMVDAKLGDGHIVLFSFNPFWRGETLGTYSLVFNALLHHGYLDATGAEEVPTTEDSSGQ
jgi:hypothetical protein